MAGELFPFKIEDRAKPETVKWRQQNTNYEIHTTLLEDLDVSLLLPHCINVRDKIDTVVTNNNHRAVSFFTVFPRTISRVLRSMWNIIVQDMDFTTENFDQALRTFIAGHSTPEDQHELLQQLRNPRKPRDVPVQNFSYRLRELNEYVTWMPGEEPALTENQLQQAFYDAMPQAWRDRFIGAGHSNATMTMPQVQRYFRLQENLAIRKIADNDKRQKFNSNNRRRNYKGSPKEITNKNNKDNKPEKTSNPKQKSSFKKKDVSGQKHRIQDDDDCPVHPGMGHKWGDCRANAYNKNKRQYNNQKSSDQHHVEISIDNEEENNSNSNHTSKEEHNDTLNIDAGGKHYLDCLTIDKHCLSFTNSPHISFLNQDFNPLTWTDDYINFISDIYQNGNDEEINISDNNTSDVLNSYLSLRPMTLLMADFIQNQISKKLLTVLFDTGSEMTFIHERVLPKGAVPKIGTPIDINTLNAMGKLNRSVLLSNIQLPEFSPTIKVDKDIKAFVMSPEHHIKYDMIIGRDILGPLGIKLHCDTQTMEWQGTRIGWKPNSYINNNPLINAMTSESHAFFINPTSVIDEYIESHIICKNPIKDSKYDYVATEEVVKQQKHLSMKQKKELAEVLQDFQPLFDGTLGRYPYTKVHLELKKDAKPFHCRPYPVPDANKAVFKQELDRLCEIGVLSKCGPSEWLSPTFIIPKKDGRVRWVSDFRALNKVLKRKVYTLPKIQDILRQRKGYQFLTKLDISMQYYTFELDEASKDLCTICTPFGNYRYERMAMGVKQSPDIAQNIMEDLMRRLEEVSVYIDDVGIFNNEWKAHLTSIRKTLTILQDANFTINPLKCEWAVKETDWLGYWLTPTGLKPWPKKINALLNIERPKTITQLRSFIGGVTFYRDMFPKRSHILSPLTAQVGKKKLIWTHECQQAFDTIKALLAKDAFLRYPDHNQPFHIYCDASDLQLGAVITQHGCPVAYYSRKLNSAQQNYTVGEKEILSIVETLKEYRSMLYGCTELHIYTDHKNLTFNNLHTQRVMRWRLFLEEYDPIFHYIKGKDNALADALSRLPFSRRQNSNEQQKIVKKPSDLYRQSDFYRKIDIDMEAEEEEELLQATATNTSLFNPNYPVENFYSMAIDEDDLVDCFVHLPDQAGLPFVLSYDTIADAQTRDAELTALVQRNPQQFIQQQLAPNVLVYCYIPAQNEPWKIYLPNELLNDAIHWYHLSLSHLGSSRLYDTMRQHFYNKLLKNRIEDLVSHCDTCQRYKLVGRGHGQNAPREATIAPWREIAVDTIGPWTLTIGDQTQTFIALTMIDMVTNLVEIVRLENKTSANVALQFVNTWLARYPRPIHVIYDQGGEFIGRDFQQMLERRNIHRHPITTKNPQANAICERMHQSIGQSLRILTNVDPPQGIAHANQLIDTAIANAVYATRASFNSSLQATPGGLAFGRDMVLDIPLIVDLEAIKNRRQQLIDNRLIRQNQKRFSHDYVIGDEVLKLTYQPDKLQPRGEGPFRIEQVHTNGTLTIRLSPNVIERINIRRVKPYRQ